MTARLGIRAGADGVERMDLVERAAEHGLLHYDACVAGNLAPSLLPLLSTLESVGIRHSVDIRAAEVVVDLARDRQF